MCLSSPLEAFDARAWLNAGKPLQFRVQPLCEGNGIDQGISDVRSRCLLAMDNLVAHTLCTLDLVTNGCRELDPEYDLKQLIKAFPSYLPSFQATSARSSSPLRHFLIELQIRWQTSRGPH